ncbi:MAG: DNA-directed RNA polymerase subunit omega [Planctomycetota bacterium]|nr:MAG: DNA-directed RNA polymerase subunit omega [Planctomycetota bacterium]
MIEALKDDEVLSKFGGRFKLCALVQARLRDLMNGARPLVEREGRSDLELVFEEILQDKITLEYAPEDEQADRSEPALL